MTDNERVEAIRAHITGIDKIKKSYRRSHVAGIRQRDVTADEFRDMSRIHRRLGAIQKLHDELHANGREDLWEEFREWAEGISKL